MTQTIGKSDYDIARKKAIRKFRFAPGFDTCDAINDLWYGQGDLADDTQENETNYNQSPEKSKSEPSVAPVLPISPRVQVIDGDVLMLGQRLHEFYGQNPELVEQQLIILQDKLDQKNRQNNQDFENNNEKVDDP